MILAFERWRLRHSKELKNASRQLITSVAPYDLYITNHPDDLVHVFHLRFKVFFQEFSQSSFFKRLYPIDRDIYDLKYQHVIVRHQKTQEIVGTYRAKVINDPKDNYYCQRQFVLDEFLTTNPDLKCEVGRACIHPDHRGGVVLAMLFHGVLHFSQQNHASLIVGQSSWSLKQCSNLETFYQYVKQHGALIENSSIIPRTLYRLENYTLKYAPESGNEIPALIKMYVKGGAKIIFPPSYESKMDCFNFFTILDLRNVNLRLFNKFNNLSRDQF